MEVAVPMLKVTLGRPAAVDARADVLAVPVFAGPELGPGAEEAVAALDAPVTPLLEARGFTGKAGEALALPTLGRLPAAALRLLAGKGVTVKVKDERELAKEGFGGIVGVGQGAEHPPRLVELRYRPQQPDGEV